jgi:hypothetical protein
MLKDIRIYNIRTMRNYNKSRIYKIWSDDEGVNEFYIGSSADFKKRCKTHYSKCNNPIANEYENKLYTYIRNNGGFGNFYIHIIQKLSCKNNRELREIEQQWITQLKHTLNNIRANRTLEDHKNDMLIYYKKYYQENKLEKKITDKEYYESNKQQILQKINCSNCDKVVAKCGYARHQKTKYCINYNSN